MVLFQRGLKAAMLALLVGISPIATAQTATDAAAQEGQTWTVNFKETDIQELIRFVAKASKKP